MGRWWLFALIVLVLIGSVRVFYSGGSGGVRPDSAGQSDAEGQSNWRSPSRNLPVTEDGRVLTSKQAYQKMVAIAEFELNRKDRHIYYEKRSKQYYKDLEMMLPIMGEEYARQFYLKYYSKDPDKENIPHHVVWLGNNTLTYLAKVNLEGTLAWLSKEGLDPASKERGGYRIRRALTVGVLKNDPEKALSFWRELHGEEDDRWLIGWGNASSFVFIGAFKTIAQTDLPKAMEMMATEHRVNRLHAFRGIVHGIPESQIAGFSKVFDDLEWTSAGTLTRTEAELGLWLERKVALRWLQVNPDAAIDWFSSRNPQESMQVKHGEYPHLADGRMQHLLYAWAVDHPDQVKAWALKQQPEKKYAAIKALGERNYHVVLDMAASIEDREERMKLAKHGLKRMTTNLQKYDDLKYIFSRSLLHETWYTVRRKINQSDLSAGEKAELLEEVDVHFEQSR